MAGEALAGFACGEVEDGTGQELAPHTHAGGAPHRGAHLRPCGASHGAMEQLTPDGNRPRRRGGAKISKNFE
jgi:hypothetical protein